MKRANLPETTWLVLVLVAIIILPNISVAGVVVGTIYDAYTNQPVPYATVRDESTGQSMSANENGEYRLRLSNGEHHLKLTHLAYRSKIIDVTVIDSNVTHDVALVPVRVEVPGITVSAHALSAGQRIIVEAIKRKKEILSKVRSYTVKAYTKLVVRNEGKNDSSSIVYLVETQLKSFWEKPDKYKEIVTARRVSANLEGKDAAVTVGEILNFNKNRLDIAGDRPVVSPTADDALDFYNYYLLDTLVLDGKQVFRLEIEPQNDVDPMLAGEILIADSTYDVVGVDATFSKGVETQFFKNVRFIQKYGIFEDEFWMPIEIRLEVDIDLPVPLLPVYFIDYVAALHEYEFNIEQPEGTFDEYVLEIDEGVDDVDSSTWEQGQLIPLTVEELGGYKRIDSVAHAPKSIPKLLLGGGLAAMYLTVAPNDFFHFNRVEGTYIGTGKKFRNLVPNTEIRLRTGYAFTGKYWQHDYKAKYTIDEKRKLKLLVGYHNRITHRPTIVSQGDANPTFMAAFSKTDPFDYYLEKGFDLGIGMKLLDHTRLKVNYLDQNQYSVPTATDFGVFSTTKHHRINPIIDDGKLRAVSMLFEYDSRNLLRIKGEDIYEFTNLYTTLQAGIEASDPHTIASDYHYRRYYVRFHRKQQTLGLGTTELSMFAGASDMSLPVQKSFAVDFGSGPLTHNLYFKTLPDTNYVGDRAAAFYITHDFGRYLFAKSGIPLIRDIPFSLGVFYGAFWTEQRNPTGAWNSVVYAEAKKPFSEIGFHIGRIPPLNFKAYFAWNLSDYDSRRFTVSLGGFLVE